MVTMRSVRNSVLALLVVYLLVSAGYWFQRRGTERAAGRSYSIVRAPFDLVGDLVAFFSSREERPPASPAGALPAIVVPGDSGSPDLWGQGRRLYLSGDFAAAVPLLRQALSRPGPDGPSSATSGTLLAQAQLFDILLAGTPAGSALAGPPQALIALAGGDPFLATVVEETADEVTFRKEGGIGARVKKSDLREQQIARTPEQKRALAEAEYQRRAPALRGAEAFLSLALFCRAYDLTGHLTYLLEKALEEPGEAVEKSLYAAYEQAREAGDTARADAVLDLLRHFFRTGTHTRNAALAHKGGTPPPPPDDGEPPAAGGTAPSSGIGGVSVRSPRGSNPELDRMLTEADRLRAEANEHYMQAQPGAPERAMHRQKALDAYAKAIELYEKVEEQWGVNLERVFKEMLERRYQLLKDTTIK